MTDREQRIWAIMEALRAQNPHPKPALNYSNSFELLTAVVLSAQTTDAAVNKVTPKLFKIAPTPKLLSELPEEEIIEVIKALGLGATKAHRLKLMAQKLVADFGGEVPDNEEDLTSLPGVGIKTARVILNIVFKKPCVAVDTHVFRVVKRLELTNGATPEVVSNLLPKVIPEEFIMDAHHYLLLHGRHICTAKRPYCEKCPVAKWCTATDKQEVKS